MTFVHAGRAAQARDILQEGCRVLEELGDRWRLVYHQLWLSWAELALGEYGRARTAAEDTLAAAREAPYPYTAGSALVNLGCVAVVEACRRADVEDSARTDDKVQQGFAEAQWLLQESVAILRKVGGQGVIPNALAILGLAARGLGRVDEASQYLRESLCIFVKTGAVAGFVYPVSGMALLLADAGEHERAVELYALASRYPYVAESRWFEDVFGRHIEAVAAALPPEVAEAARDRGRALDLQTTVKELLAELEADGTPDCGA
jgi:tetratricopeptide (TPR) repeat protein